MAKQKWNRDELYGTKDSVDVDYDSVRHARDAGCDVFAVNTVAHLVGITPRYLMTLVSDGRADPIHVIPIYGCVGESEVRRVVSVATRTESAQAAYDLRRQWAAGRHGYTPTDCSSGSGQNK